MIAKTLLPLIAALTITAPAVVGAAGLDLTWDRCPGVAGSLTNELFDCPNSFSYVLYGRFNLPVTLTNVVAMDCVLDITTESATLPTFWKMESGDCNDSNNGSLFVYHTKPTTGCGTASNPVATWGTTPSSAVTALGYLDAGHGNVPPGANRARILISIARISTGLNLSAGTNYFGFQLLFDLFNAQENGTGSCQGCTTPVCIRWTSAKLYPQTGSPYTLTGPGTIGDLATINSPSFATCISTTDVPQVTANDVTPIQVWPNPSTSEIAVAFSLPAGALIRMEVFDVHGRRVRVSPLTYLAAGPHTLAWDGRGDDGSAQAAGVYLVHVSGPGLDVARRVIHFN